MPKLIFKVFANILLLILGVISVLATITAFKYTGEPWPEHDPVQESHMERRWVCVGVSQVPDRIPHNQLDPTAVDNRPITITEFRSFLSFWPLEQVTFLQKEDGEVMRFEQKSAVLTLFRLATYVLGWVALVRFCIIIPRNVQKFRRALKSARAEQAG